MGDVEAMKGCMNSSFCYLHLHICADGGRKRLVFDRMYISNSHGPHGNSILKLDEDVTR
jgi:hypothetical protein